MLTHCINYIILFFKTIIINDDLNNNIFKSFKNKKTSFVYLNVLFIGDDKYKVKYNIY